MSRARRSGSSRTRTRPGFWTEPARVVSRTFPEEDRTRTRRVTAPDRPACPHPGI